MKRLSLRGEYLIKEVESSGGAFDVGWWAGSECEPAMVFPLFDRAISAKSKPASRALDYVVRHLPRRDLILVDQALRQRAEWWGVWRAVDLGTPGRLAREGSLVLLALCSSHPSGYVRERVVRLLDGSEDPLVLPFLLIRTNDWVDEVHRIALEAVRRRLTEESIPGFLESFDLVRRLQGDLRRDLVGLREEVETLLLSSQNSPHLTAALSNADPRLRRLAFDLAHRSGFDRRELARRGMSDPQPFLRRWTMNKILDSLPDETAEHYLREGLRERCAPVRLTATERWIERFPGATELLQELLFDPHRVVRSLAQRALASKGVPVGDKYRDSLETSLPLRRLAATIEGLGEVGEKTDVAPILDFRSHASPRVREATVRALHALAPRQFDEYFFAALEDPSPRVARRACLALQSAVIEPDRIRELFWGSRLLHARYEALRLMELLPKWERAIQLVPALDDTEPTIASRARDAFDRWRFRFNRSFAEATSDQQRRLQEVVDNAGPGLTREEREWLRFCFRH